MKSKMTAIIASTIGTMLVVMGFILPASARNLPRSINLQKQNHVSFLPIRPNPIVLAQLELRESGPMRNPLSRNPNKTQRIQANDAIDMLNYDDLHGGSGKVVNLGGIRIDLQGSTGDAQNMQVQVNGVPGSSTVAAALVPLKYLHLKNDHAKAQVLQQVREALKRSFRDFLADNPTIYTIDGNLPHDEL